METVRNLLIQLREEIDYHQSVIEHKRKLEATLWGLEEQSTFPENSGKVDQEEISEETNRCRSKILNCTKLISAHEIKVKQILKEFVEN